jgi:hypothetical protein
MLSLVLKIKKEERMKKLVIIALALFLALPAVTFAGSATSRWDMTIGGYVKVDWGWSDKGIGTDSFTAPRKSGSVTGARESVAAEYGTMSAGAGETRLNFLVKGPDAWGAKTSALVEFDFRGAGYGGTNPYDTAFLRHAFLKFDWANDSLLIGKFWSNYNLIPIPIALIANNEMGEAKANRVPQITWGHKFGKSVTTSLALLASSPDAQGAVNNGYSNDYVANSYARSMTPFLSGGIDFASDACGKIGTTKLGFGGSGVIGYTKETWNSLTNTRDVETKNVKSWGLSTYATVPIIPEKNNNKAGAWGVAAGGQAFSNITSILGPVAVFGAYSRGTQASHVEVAPTYIAWWATTNFFFTDKVSLNAFYSSTRLANASHVLTNNWSATSPLPKVNDQYALILAYDVNPAIRLAAEVSQIYTQYIRDAVAVDSDRGKANIFRLGAWYYF